MRWKEHRVKGIGAPTAHVLSSAHMSPERTSQGWAKPPFASAIRRETMEVWPGWSPTCAEWSRHGKRRRKSSSPCRHVLVQNSGEVQNSKFKLSPPSYYKSVFGIIHSPLLFFLIRNPALSPLPCNFQLSTWLPHHKSQFSTSLADGGDHVTTLQPMRREKESWLQLWVTSFQKEIAYFLLLLFPLSLD